MNRIKRAIKVLLGRDNPVAKTNTKQPQHKFVPNADEKYNWIKEMNIQTVLDVGAHEGKTAIQFLTLFPQATIHSFEPIPECYTKLVERTQQQNRCKTYNVAVGESNGTIEFNQSAYSPSSSILPMAKAHEQAFPFTSGGTKVQVNVITLDSFVQQQTLQQPIAVKIDVQGYEWQVLQGATNALEKIEFLLIETSFVELYKDQKLFEQVYQYLLQKGFVYAGSFDQLFDPNNGKPIQQDAIFVKK